MSSYAGDVAPADAWRMLDGNDKATLVDVRTVPEWAYVGIPDLGAIAKEPILLEWQTFPQMTPDPGFTDKLSSMLHDRTVPHDAPLLFLCRSGARSRAAAVAMTAAGYSQSFNIIDGFEGPPDGDGHRGAVSGWKVSGLPWRQS